MSTTQQGKHSLAFRVMRLCNPSLHVKPPFRLDPTDLFVGEDIFDDPLPPPTSLHFYLATSNLIATKLGVQRISGITVSDTREKKSYDPLPDVEIFVESDWFIK